MEEVSAMCAFTQEDLDFESEHLCMLYTTGEEYTRHTVRFLRDGIECNERVMHISSSIASPMADSLQKGGVDVDHAVAKGRVNLMAARNIYYPGGTFDPDTVLHLLERETDRALADGYSGLRVASDMNWIRKSPPGCDRLIEFESKLNYGLPKNNCVVLCQYDRRNFGPAVLLYLLTTHPKIMSGSRVCRNQHYGVFPISLGRDTAGYTLHRWLRAIA